MQTIGIMKKVKTIDDFHQARQNCFDWIRFLGATFVIFVHSFALTGTNNIIIERLFLFPNGVYYVLVAFFVISGFLITESYVRRDNPLAFLKCRILRIYPALIACALFCTFVIGIIATSLPIHAYLTHSRTYGYFITNATLYRMHSDLPGVFMNNPKLSAVDGSSWTLPIEFRCYLLVLGLGIFQKPC